MRQTLIGVAVLALCVTGVAQAQVGNNQGLLNPNVAGAEELATLPGLTGELVEAIMDQRPFLGITPLNNLLGLSLDEGQLEELYRRLFVPLDLNTASREAILLVPGYGAQGAGAEQDIILLRRSHRIKRAQIEKQTKADHQPGHTIHRRSQRQKNRKNQQETRPHAPDIHQRAQSLFQDQHP